MLRNPIEHRIPLENTELCYFEWSGTDDSLVLLLHATGFHARCWDKTVAELPESCRVIAVDLRGHGRSSKTGPFGWFDFGKDVVNFIDALELKNIVTAGHSMGGHCALYASSLRTERFKSLVLVDPVVLSPEQYAEQIPTNFASESGEHPIARRRAQWQSPDEMFEAFKDRHPFSLWQLNILRDYCHYGLLHTPDGYELACPPRIEAQIYMGTGQRDLKNLLHNVTCPTVVMRAKQRIGPRETMDFSNSPTWPGLAHALPNARDIYLPDLSHFIPMQRPDLVADEIRDQLTD
ncbi:MAG: alpha/beta hydrolase [Gammaproteobacteria bacterium]|nr:alpha/beta hydrolase [Gammaproteobacteria bacterium]